MIVRELDVKEKSDFFSVSTVYSKKDNYFIQVNNYNY